MKLVRSRGRVFTVLAVASMAVPMLVAQSATGAPTSSDHTLRAQLDGVSRTLPDGSVLTQKSNRGHVVAELRLADGSTATASAPLGSTIVAVITSNPLGHRSGATGDPGTADVSVEAPDTKLSGLDPQALVAAHKSSGRSVITDAMETGMTYEAAVSTFGDMGDAIPTKAKAQAVVSGVAAPVGAASAFPSAFTAAAPAVYITGGTPQILDSLCVNFTGGPANHATSHGCDIRYLDYAVNGNWYISNKMKSSAIVSDWYYQMVAHDVWVGYYSGNSWVDWEPSRTYSEGQCSTLTLGVTDPKTGVNISYGTSICPNSLSPVWASSAYLGFGGIWRGGSTGYENAIAVGVVHNPPGYSDAYSVHVWVQWG